MADVDLTADEIGAYDVALVANTAKTVGFARDLGEVEVANSGGTTKVYVAFLDSGNAKAATVAGKHCYVVHPNTAATIPVRTDGNTLVSLISSGATTVDVSRT
jgi:hypothetical protein